MFAVSRFWRRSLALRVVATTALLSLAVIWILGSALLTRVSDGLVDRRVDAALVEASSSVVQAQSRLDAVDSSDPLAVSAVVDQIVSLLASASGSAGAREVVLLKADLTPEPAVPLDRASNLVEPTSVPAELRGAVLSSDRQAWTYLPITYDNGIVEPGVAVGSKVAIPGAGLYEIYLLFPLTSEQNTIDLVRRTLALAGVVLVLLVAAITWLVVLQVVTPVRMASRIAARLAKGELHERMRVHGEDDLARLAASFNEMASSLQKQITRLEDLSRFQQRFVSDVSHELRTPLTTVRMAADMVHTSSASFDPALARSSELLQIQLERFENLLADLLEISRFDAGVASLDLEPLDLKSLAAGVVDGLAPLAAARGSVVTIESEEQIDYIVEADRRRVSRILRNLVANAIEHGEGRSIELTLGANAGAVAIGVRDFGVGLRPGEAEHVFERFWRADLSRARGIGGTGLGLSISHEDAKLHRGWLQAWGESGAGANFVLTLPRHPNQAITSSPVPVEPLKVERT
jgi:two-component system, OmpR family, sensor histidine kinase MtrB